MDVAVLLRETVDSAVSDSGTNGPVQVDVPDAPWPLPTRTGDSGLLLVAVYNVIANAIKYTTDGDVIEVRAREAPDGRAVLIEVADTGPGVADDELQWVWDEPRPRPGRSAVPGSGVGLALVRLIVHRHGGTVALRSRLGHGASVLLQLPAG